MLRRVAFIIAYALVGAAVIAATFILVAVGEGYSYDFRTNQFVLNGLIVLNTAPVSGNVYINGKSVHRQTPYRTTLQAGDYDLEIHRDGYRTWKKHVVIQPSEVTDIQQIILIPNKLKYDNETQQAVSAVYTSADHKHFAYLTNGEDPGIWVLNVDKRQSSKIYSPAPVNGDVPAESLVAAVWSADGSHLLVTTRIGDVFNYLIVPAGGGSAINLTDVFKFDLAGLQFSPYDWHELFWLSPEGLRKLNVDSKTVSAPLAGHVASFTFAGDKLIYIQATPTGKAVYSMDRNGNSNKRLVESVADSDSYEITFGNYRGRDLLAVIPRQTTTATLYMDIYGSTPTSAVVSKTANHIAFSPNGRYLAFYSNTGFGSYDVDQAELSLSARNIGPLQSLVWLDNFHVLLNAHDQAAVAEADGDNITYLEQVTPGTPVFATGDQRHVIYFQDKANQPSRLHITELRP